MKKTVALFWLILAIGAGAVAVSAKNINPIFSVPGGQYSDAVRLWLTPPSDASDNTQIRYTLNGDEPTQQSSLYTKPITVLSNGQSVVVRAACFNDKGELLGRIKTNTYFPTAPRTMRVVCLTTDNANLYGDTGIVTHSEQSGSDWERPVHVEIYHTSGTLLLAQNAGIRVSGGTSRTSEQHSFKLIARKDGYYDKQKYNGAKNFKGDLLNRTVEAGKETGKLKTKFSRLLLRNGGNDSLLSTSCDATAPTLIRDGLCNNFMALTAPHVAVQSSVFVTVYLNGAYYGILDLKEDINDDYFCDTYGIEDNKSLAILKSELDTTRHCDRHENGAYCRYCGVWFYYDVDAGELSDLEDFLSLAQRAIDCPDSEKTALYRELTRKMDTDSFIEYMATNMYVCNTDWPHNNVKIWRVNHAYQEGNPYTDGKWRFAARDMDFAFGRYRAKLSSDLYCLADTDMFRYVLGNYQPTLAGDNHYPDSLLLGGLLDFCLKNNAFRARFTAYCEKLASPRMRLRMDSLFEASQALLRPEMPAYIACYRELIAPDYTMDTWNAAVGEMSTFLKERPAYFMEDLYEAMGVYEGRSIRE